MIPPGFNSWNNAALFMRKKAYTELLYTKKGTCDKLIYTRDYVESKQAPLVQTVRITDSGEFTVFFTIGEQGVMVESIVDDEREEIIYDINSKDNPAFVADVAAGLIQVLIENDALVEADKDILYQIRKP